MTAKRIQPYAVFSDGHGNMYEDTRLLAAGRSGQHIYPLYLDQMIPLPEGSELLELPGRRTLGFTRNGELRAVREGFASAAFIAPAHTQLAVAAWRTSANAPVLPLYAYTAVAWWNDEFYVPAVRIDPDQRQDCCHFDQRVIEQRGRQMLRKYPKNRLVEHLVRNCACTYYCPAARNLMMGRWEAPIPTSPQCNARCVGCISYQNPQESPVSESQHRLGFVPTPEEIAEYVVPHLENAPNPVASFGQGCEGEPLLQWELLRDAIRAIRARTKRGIINLNTNGSKPQAVEELFRAGLDSIRVSMNSAQEPWYNLYYRPVGYTMADAIESLCMARKYGRWASINYFVMPGLTDTPQEMDALRQLIKRTELSMVQWRNFNIDPDWFFSRTGLELDVEPLGVRRVMDEIRREFPKVCFGYYNPHADTMADFGMVR